MQLIVNTLSVTPRRGGVKTYITNLVKALAEVDEKNRIVLLCSRLNKSLFRKTVDENRNVESKVLSLGIDRPGLRVLYDQIAVPLHCRRFENAVLLSQASASSLAAPLPEVVVLQTPLSVRSIRRKVPPSADTTSLAQRLYYDTMLPLTLRRADEVVAVSDHLRKAVIESYPRFKSKLRTVHEGVNIAAFSGNRKNDYGDTTQSPYLLFVSTLFRYKRADQAIRSFAKAVKRFGMSDVRLKLAGRDPGGEEERLERIARENKVADRVDVLGAVEHSRMPGLYSGALALLFPSTVETFGLPVLEAMACGTPVIASNRMSVPEVVGNAGLIVDPTDSVEMARAICRLMKNGSLRARLESAGKKRVQKFTWRRTAEGVWDAVQDARRANAT